MAVSEDCCLSLPHSSTTYLKIENLKKFSQFSSKSHPPCFGVGGGEACLTLRLKGDPEDHGTLSAV